jgi:hypothetical protein
MYHGYKSRCFVRVCARVRARRERSKILKIQSTCPSTCRKFEMSKKIHELAQPSGIMGTFFASVLNFNSITRQANDMRFAYHRRSPDDFPRRSIGRPSPVSRARCRGAVAIGSSVSQPAMHRSDSTHSRE